jgi:hypothetical protein
MRERCADLVISDSSRHDLTLFEVPCDNHSRHRLSFDAFKIGQKGCHGEGKMSDRQMTIPARDRILSFDSIKGYYLACEWRTRCDFARDSGSSSIPEPLLSPGWDKANSREILVGREQYLNQCWEDRVMIFICAHCCHSLWFEKCENVNVKPWCSAEAITPLLFNAPSIHFHIRYDERSIFHSEEREVCARTNTSERESFKIQS